jgi:hypothetical protein
MTALVVQHFRHCSVQLGRNPSARDEVASERIVTRHAGE